MQFFGGTSEATLSPSVPSSIGTGPLGSNAYMLYLFNRNGVCLLYKEWHRPLKTLDSNQDQKLMFGLLFSLKSFTAKMDPTSVEKGNLGVPLLPGEGCSFHSFRTNTYKLSFMESPSGIKVCDPSVSVFKGYSMQKETKKYLSSEIAKYGVLSTFDHTSVASICLFATLLCACIVIGHLLEENRWVNESITALLIGLVTGFIILITTQWKHSHILVFSEDLFFIYLLPPIIFNAGAVGTLISFSIISLGAITLLGKINIGLTDIGDYLALGAIFSATDSVCTLQVLNQDETPLLYSLVFGEGVVNDATSVVFFNAIQHFDLVNIDFTIILHFAGNFLYLFFTSMLLGVGTGLLSAFVIKNLYFGRHSIDREVSLMMLMAYLSYLLAEIVQSFAAEYLKTPLGEPVKSKKNKSSTELWVEKFVGFTCTPFIIPYYPLPT